VTTPCRFVSAAGNRFVLIDADAARLPEDPGAWARALRDPATWDGEPPPWASDGLLVVRAPRTPDHDGVMEIYNVDGSRPEACGNGLRCVARYLFDARRSETDVVRIATDAGPRRVRIEQRAGAVVATADMGMPVLAATGVELTLGAGRRLEATVVSMGNPHCVVLVPDERAAPVDAWGHALQRDARFAGGTNLELVSLRESQCLSVRVWERGVGETRACGTGACAAALVIAERSLRSWPIPVRMPGGDLTVDENADATLSLSGIVLDEGAGAIAAS